MYFPHSLSHHIISYIFHVHRYPPAFIVARSDQDSLIGSATRAIGTDLQSLVSDYPNVIDYTTDYYSYISDPDRAFLASTSLSANNLTMVYGIHFKAGADNNDMTDAVYKLLNFAAEQSYPNIHVGCTGLQPLLNELTDAGKLSIELIDSVVLPIAVAILGFNLRSYRHMLVAIVNLGCTLLLTLAILVPIAKATYFNTFAPSIFLTLGISICFDYSLFMLCRDRKSVV